MRETETSWAKQNCFSRFFGLIVVGSVSVFWMCCEMWESSSSFESAEARFLGEALVGAGVLGLSDMASRLDQRYAKSYLRDLGHAAEIGETVRRIDFVNSNADYGGVSIVLQQWASTNNVSIIFTRRSPSGFAVYVRPGDAGEVSKFLRSMSFDELSPFE